MSKSSVTSPSTTVSSSSSESIDLNPQEQNMTFVQIPPQTLPQQVPPQNTETVPQNVQQQSQQNTMNTGDSVFTPQVDTTADQPSNDLYEDDQKRSGVTKELHPLIQIINLRIITVSFVIFIFAVLICYIICIFMPKARVEQSISTWQCECTESLNWNKTCCKGVNIAEKDELIVTLGPFTPLNKEFTLEGQFKNLKKGANGGSIQFGVDIIGLYKNSKNDEYYQEL